jgi:hypothetical protein
MEIDGEGRWKVIYRITDNVYELYDLAADPDEQKNLVERHHDVARKAKAALARWMESGL